MQRSVANGIGYVLFVLGTFFAGSAVAQQVRFNSADVSDKKVMTRLFSILKKNTNANDSIEFQKSLREVRQSLFQDGYLEGAVDSITQADSVKTVWWHIGNRYKLASLTHSSGDEPVLAAAGVRDRIYINKPFSPAAFSRLTTTVLKWCANNGYPFALVRLDSVRIDSSSIHAKLVVDKGPLMLMDTMVVKGNAKISQAYLANYLSVKPGTPFNESVVNKIGVRLKELPFIAESRGYQMEYYSGYARPVLYLQNKKASQFNGIIGLLQDNAKAGKVYVTGDVRLRLLNSFGHAELLDLNWTNPQPKTQDLKIKSSLPFILSSPFGVDADLALYKKDTTYLEFFRQIGFRYSLAGNSAFKVFFGRKTSNLISTIGYDQITTLPPYADVGANTFGLGLQLEKLDYRLNPRKGYSFEVTVGAGVRKITKNAKVNAVVYDSLKLKSTQYNSTGSGDVYFPIGGRSVINIGVTGGYLESPSIFQNELYRFGGLKSLRGFDESSLLASRYLIGKSEYRFILEQNSYLLLFFNEAYYENRGAINFTHDHPYGFGAGLTFETKAGIFSFTYALGSQQNNPILFKSGKIHFGLVNYF